MKLISLNTWGGRAGKANLLAFFEANKDVDIFCLQEILSAPYQDLYGSPAGGLAFDHTKIMNYGLQEISTVLSNHMPYFKPHYLDNYGLMMLVKKDIDVISEGETFVYKEKGHVPVGDVGTHARNLQYVTLATKDGDKTILNFHGLWNGQGKGDSEDRIIQSKKILQFINTLSIPFVLAGDFNLLPDSQSLRMIEDSGLRNLIKEYGISSTRTSLYKKEEKFADYIFVTDEIKVNDFKVMSDEVSDHSPLLLGFE